MDAMLAEVYVGTKSLTWSILRGGHWFALFAFFFPLAFDRLRRLKRKDDLVIVLGVAACVSLLPLAMAAVWMVKFSFGRSPLDSIPLMWSLSYLAVFVGSAAGGLLFLREASALIDKFKARVTKRTSLERNRKTDVREIHKFLPPPLAEGFDPRNYFEPKKGIFFGLNEQHKPIYLDYQDLRIRHLLLTGMTRSGKGVAAQILIPQLVARGELVVVLDPKFDEWMPQVFYAACRDARVPYRFLNLNQSQPPQFNPLFGCDAEALENILIGGFSLTEKGEAADFYRLNDRKAARRCAAWLASNPEATARDAVAEFGDAWAECAKAFLEYMREVADLDPANAVGGLDLAQCREEGGLVYVVGDMLNTRVLRVQRMIMLRLLYLAKQTAYRENQRPIFVFADEFRVHISRPFVLSLGASAGWGMHTMLAMQSLADLSDCPADLSDKVVAGSVFENTAIKISYKLDNQATAELLAESTGRILVDDEMRRVNRNLGLAETVEGERSIRQSDRPLIDTNMFLNLPKGCGVLRTPHQLAQFVYTSPIRAPKDPRAVQVMPARTTSPASECVRLPAGDPLL